jgi:ankyrin repeat protein
MLLEAKANVNALSNKETALMAAAEYGNLDVVNALIQARANISLIANGKTALHFACSHPNSTPIVAALLAARARVDAPGTTASPLNLTIGNSRTGIHGSLETLKLLIAAQADVNGHAYKESPLAASTAHYNIASMRLLLDANADVDCRHHPVESSPLIGAVSLGDVKMTKFLISAGADLTIRDEKNMGCLDHLVSICAEDGSWVRPQMMDDTYYADRCNESPYDYPGVLKVLIDAKADISVQGCRSFTTLHVAAYLHNDEAVNALLAVGASPSDVDDCGQTALHIAADNGCLGAVSALIAAGADANSVDRQGGTPLLSAVFNSHSDIVSALIAANADVNYYSSNQDHICADRTALDVAMDTGCDDIMEALVINGACTWVEAMSMNGMHVYYDDNGHIRLSDDHMIVNGTDKDKENALKVAIVCNGLNAVKHLLAAGVNPSIQYRGMSILCFASAEGAIDIVRELLDAGADITVKDDGGMTALQWAAKGRHRDVVTLLLAKTKKLKKTNKKNKK